MSFFAGSNRSKFESAAYTVLLLAFFFAVGLAGGVLYRLMPTDNGAPIASPEIASRTDTPAPVEPPASATPAKPVASQAPTAPTKPVVASPPPAPAKQVAAPAPAAPAKPATPPTPATPTPQAVASAPPKSVAPQAKVAPPPDTAMNITLPATTNAGAAPSTVATSVEIPPVATEPATTQDHTATSSASASRPPARTTKVASKPAQQPPAVKPKVEAVATAQQPPKPPVAAEAAPAPTAAQASDAATGPIRVQFGAYAIEDNAHRTQWAVEATGMPVEVTRMPSPKGRMLYYVRSQPFSDRAAALTAASAARDKAKNFVNAEPIEFVLVDDNGRPVSQTQAAQR